MRRNNCRATTSRTAPNTSQHEFDNTSQRPRNARAELFRRRGIEMRTDPVVELATELRRTDRAFDQALAEQNAPKVAHLGARLVTLTAAMHARQPTTPKGAAILLWEAAGALRECDDPAAKSLAKTINPIARRLARGNRTEADALALRAAQALSARIPNGAEHPETVPALIARALRGATAPVLVSGADDHSPEPRARSAAKLQLVR
jgi:hypothetical protein